LTYQLPGRALSMIRAAQGSTIVLGARNLHLWTNFTGLDPESNYGVTGAELQNEFNTAPQPTYLTMRLNLKY
jgi:hypothetical protein